MNFKLKKLTAVMFAAAGIIISALSASAENVLFDIDFTTDYGTAGDNAYTLSELAETHSAVMSDWETKTGFTIDVENGRAKVINSTSSAGVLGISLSTGTVEKGALDIDFKFRMSATNGGANDSMRRIRINGKDVIGTNKYGQSYYFMSDTSDKWLSNHTTELDMGIVIQRADETSDWSLKVYNNATNALLASTTLSKADYPSITTFSVVHTWAEKKDGANGTGMDLYSLKGTHSDIEPATLEVSENMDVASDIVINFPETIAESEAQSFELKKVSDDEVILVNFAWAADDRLAVTPLKYLDEGAEYELLIKGMDGVSGINYDGTLKFTTKAADSLVKETKLTFLDENGEAVGEENAVGVKAEITVSNETGASKKLMAVISVYDESGKLLNTNVTQFTESSETEIPITVSVSGEENLQGTSVKTLILERLESGIIIKVN